MKNRFFLASLVIILLMSSPLKAETEIGLIGQSGWSDNFYFANPDGWGLTLSQSLSQKMAIRFSFSRFENSFGYIGILSLGFPPIYLDTSSEIVSAYASANFYELSLHHNLLNGNKMRLETGGGLGVSSFDLDLVGGSTGRTLSTSQIPIILTLSIDVTVKKFLYSPFALRLGYQYRTMGAIPILIDGFQPFRNVNLSVARIDLLAKL